MAACTAGALVIRCGGSSRGFARVPKVCMQIPQRHFQHQQHSIVETVQKKLREIAENRALRNAAFGALNLLAFNLPAGLALGVEEKGKIFDFNGTLPFIVLEILFLTFFLDKVFFKPVMKHMDDRDYIIKKMQDAAKMYSDKAEALEAEIEATLVATKAEALALYQQKDDKYRRMYDDTVKRLKQEKARHLAVVRAKIIEEIRADEENRENETKELAKLILSKVLPANVNFEKVEEELAKVPVPSIEELDNYNYLPKPPAPF